jgi:glycosyltransferase involved in cell wall biosynthesis
LELPAGEAELVIAGRGAQDYERKLREMAHDGPDVHWLGLVPPEVLLSQVDVLVVPSRWHDPAPVVVLEGMANSLPLIGSCRGGIPELMGEGTGWIIDPDEPDSLLRAMKLAISSRSDLGAMSSKAGERARRFSTEFMVSEYLQAFSRAIQNNDNNHERR